MRDQLLLASAAAALLAFPAFAQAPGAAPPAASMPSAGTATGADAAGRAATTPPPVNPMPESPPAPTTATPSTGASSAASAGANTSATESDLQTGAVVRDSAGMEVGRISKVTKGKSASADSMVTLSSGGKTMTVPASSLSMSNGALVTSRTKADLWGPK